MRTINFSQKSAERKALSHMEHHDRECSRHPMPRGIHPGEGQAPTHTAQRSFTQGYIDQNRQDFFRGQMEAIQGDL